MFGGAPSCAPLPLMEEGLSACLRFSLPAAPLALPLRALGWVLPGLRDPERPGSSAPAPTAPSEGLPPSTPPLPTALHTPSFPTSRAEHYWAQSPRPPRVGRVVAGRGEREACGSPQLCGRRPAPPRQLQPAGLTWLGCQQREHRHRLPAPQAPRAGTPPPPPVRLGMRPGRMRGRPGSKPTIREGPLPTPDPNPALVPGGCPG